MRLRNEQNLYFLQYLALSTAEKRKFHLSNIRQITWYPGNMGCTAITGATFHYTTTFIDALLRWGVMRNSPNGPWQPHC